MRKAGGDSLGPDVAQRFNISFYIPVYHEYKQTQTAFIYL